MFLFWSITLLGLTVIEPTTHGGIVVVVVVDVVLVVVDVVDVVVLVELVGEEMRLTVMVVTADVAPSGSVTWYCRTAVPGVPKAVNVTEMPLADTDQPPGTLINAAVKAPPSGSWPSSVNVIGELSLTVIVIGFAVGGWLGATVLVVVVDVVVVVVLVVVATVLTGGSVSLGFLDADLIKTCSPASVTRSIVTMSFLPSPSKSPAETVGIVLLSCAVMFSVRGALSANTPLQERRTIWPTAPLITKR
jgi:hypothetical protein